MSPILKKAQSGFNITILVMLFIILGLAIHSNLPCLALLLPLKCRSGGRGSDRPKWGVRGRWGGEAPQESFDKGGLTLPCSLFSPPGGGFPPPFGGAGGISPLPAVGISPRRGDFPTPQWGFPPSGGKSPQNRIMLFYRSIDKGIETHFSNFMLLGKSF